MGGDSSNIENNDRMRIFDNDVLEFFSRCHFSVPFILFVPVTIFSLFQSYMEGYEIALILITFLLAIIAWTLFEYFAHSFLLHIGGKILGNKNFLQKSHTRHHDYPLDKSRVVLSPIVSVPGAVLFFLLFYFTMGAQVGYSFFAGFVFGYLIYDFVHYTVHHKKYNSILFNKLKRHHLVHHYKFPDKNFGLSVVFWDKVFKTIV